MQGRIKVTGNMGKLMSLMPLTQSAEYKAIAEKLDAVDRVLTATSCRAATWMSSRRSVLSRSYASTVPAAVRNTTVDSPGRSVPVSIDVLVKPWSRVPWLTMVIASPTRDLD